MTEAAEPSKSEVSENESHSARKSPHSDLARILKGHLEEQGLSSHAIARRVSEMTAVPELLSRSTVRNWISGSSSSANDWTQIAAIAAVLKLDGDQADELLTAASLPDLAELRSYPDVSDLQASILRNWTATERSQEPIDLSGPAPSASVSLAPVSQARGSRTGSGSSFLPPQVGNTGTSKVGTQAVLLATLGVLGLALIFFGFQFTRRSDNDNTTAPNLSAPAAPSNESSAPTTTLDVTEIPPLADIASPHEDSTIGHDLVFSGTAAHPAGVAHVEAILQRLDAGIYWNPEIDEGVWQQRNQRFVIPVYDSQATETTWKYDFPTALPEGRYRFRAWARSTQGRGDPIGPLVEFEAVLVEEPDDVYEMAMALQVDAIPEPEEPENAAKTRVGLPEHGARVSNPFRLRASAEHEFEALEQLAVSLYSTTANEYWNFDVLKWQRTPHRQTLEPETVDGGKIEFDIWLPAGALPPGTYTATAEGTTESGVTSTRENTFSVMNR